VRQPRRKAERLRASPMQPRPARRSEEGMTRLREPADAAAEASLRQAEQIFQAIFDNTSDGIFLLDLEAGKFTMCNPSCLQMLGYTQEEFLRLSIADVHAPDDLPFIYARIEELLKGGKPPGHDVRFHRKDGSVVFTDLSPRLLVLKGRRYILVALKDITERKRMEEELRQHAEHLEELVAARTGELRESEARYRGLYHTIADGVFVMGAEGRIDDVNDSACAQLGYTRAELIGLPVSAISARPDFRLDEIMDRLRAAGNLSYETVHRRKDGTVIPVELSVALIEYRGRPAALGVARDITERKQAEEALAESRKRYCGLVEKINDWAWEVDADCVYTYASPRALELLGYAPEEIVGKTPFDFMPPDEAERVRNAFQPICRARKPLELLENTLVRKDGRLVTVETSGMPVFAEDGTFRGYMGIDRDVTSRKQAEEALREKEYLLSESQRIGHIGTWSGDPVTNAGTWTPEMYRLFGVSPNTFVPTVDTFLALLHPDDRGPMREWMRAALAGEHPGALEVRVPLADGSVRVLIGRGEAIFADDHRPVRLVGTAQDVTEQKRAEEALRESEQRYRRLVENLKGSHFVYRHDTTGMLTYVSESVTQVLGYTLDEGLPHYGKYFTDHPANQAAYGHTELTLQGIRQPPYEVNVWHKDGSSRWLEVQEVPVFDAAGRVVAVEGVAQDITERKQAEEALRKSEEKFAKAFRSSPIAVSVTRLSDGRIVEVNEAMLKLLHFRRDEVMGRTTLELSIWVDVADRAAFIGTVARKGSAHDVECRLRTRDGDIVTTQLSAELLEFGGEPCMLATLVDLTERKRAQEALRRMNEQLELQVAQRTEDLRHTVDRLRQLTLELSQAEDRERKRIADVLHEDVQQTLAAARFHLNLLGSGTRSVQESTEIVEQVKRMLHDAIERSRSLSHELSPVIYQVGIVEILDWLARHMRREHGLDVRVVARGPVDSSSEPLKAFLYKVIQELLFNVVKHAGVSQARVRVRRMGRNICLSVVDRGKGFDPERLEAAGGFGLLSIRERIQLLGGRMKIRSRPGGGSRFVIVIPDQGSSAMTLAAESSHEQAQPRTPTQHQPAGES
jgi:PAS domain S-box-containing protein